MRYYLALHAYIEQRKISPDHLFERSANAWFDLTEKYHDQLYELSKEEYLSSKKHERYNQLVLQKK